jgi:hypothetical protein
MEPDIQGFDSTINLKSSRSAEPFRVGQHSASADNSTYGG